MTNEGQAAEQGEEADSPPSDHFPAGQTRRAALWSAAEVRGVPLRAILATIVAVIVFYLAGKVIYRLRDVILLIIVAGFIALLLNPLVVYAQRWVRRRGIAVAIVTVLALIFFAGLAVAFGYPLVNGITHLADNLPGYVSKAEHGKGWIGHLVIKYHVQNWVTANAPKLASYGKDIANPVISVGKGAISLMITLLTIFVLVVLLQMEGPKLRTGLLGLMEPARAERYRRVASAVNGSVTGYMLGNFATSIIAGLVVLVTLLVLGVPFPFLWALWVALVDFLPMIGGALAGIPVVLFALTQGLAPGLVTLIVFVLYTQIENHALNPLIMSKTVRINPLLVLISILVGASIGSWISGIFGGFVVALLSIPLAGAVQVIVREIWRSTDPAVLNPGLVSAPADASGSGPSTQAAATQGADSGLQQERRALPRLPYQWSRRLPGRRQDSASGPPA
ncbi:MAG: AI-2E family transporter [Nocardiopsaceae bacterium]|jgi:predicted PurR-regulated permease PerM|nr:AI-2E family transporter [Nocardiopsaceae bacterium]